MPRVVEQTQLKLYDIDYILAPRPGPVRIEKLIRAWYTLPMHALGYQLDIHKTVCKLQPTSNVGQRYVCMSQSRIYNVTVVFRPGDQLTFPW